MTLDNPFVRIKCSACALSFQGSASAPNILRRRQVTSLRSIWNLENCHWNCSGYFRLGKRPFSSCPRPAQPLNFCFHLLLWLRYHKKNQIWGLSAKDNLRLSCQDAGCQVSPWELRYGIHHSHQFCCLLREIIHAVVWNFAISWKNAAFRQAASSTPAGIRSTNRLSKLSFSMRWRFAQRHKLFNILGIYM